ncbi:exocyst complex component 3-like protein 2 [Carettochelys insculpta]|uniref:exocyst complex component 3-like protein 2 n=1 Tax=Carettochelys insculpta TaxID=44489 RepID=UPI003EBEDEF3
MPVLKNPCKLKMAKANGPALGPGELILADERSTNPFAEDLEENAGDSCLGGPNPFLEEEEAEEAAVEGSGFQRNLFTGSLDGRYQRRATLERLVGLSPFRLGKGRKGAGKEKGLERRSFLGRLLEGEPDKQKARRSSEDFSLLQRLNGRRRESPGGPESGTPEPGGALEPSKRMSFLKLGRARRASLADKPGPPEAPELAPSTQEGQAVAQAKEPLSVLEILTLIQQRDLLAADAHIIELEAECGQEAPAAGGEAGEGGKAGSRKTKDVALLYEALLQQLWAVLAEALAARAAYPPLGLVVQVIEQEEAEDRRGAGGTGTRPRAMRRRWAEAVERAVSERLGRCAEEGGDGPLAGQVERLSRCLVEDLGAVRSHLLPVYPPEYQALGVYARSYHQALARIVGRLARSSLSIAELYFLLDWHSNTYPREVLGRLDIAPLLSAHEQEPLLPPETQRRLEDACVAAVEARVAADMSRELREEEQRWAQEPGRDHGQQLSSRVIAMLKVHADRAPRITPAFGEQIVLCCLAGLAEFLQSFQSKVERFHDRLGESGPPTDSYLGRTIALVNCCPPFRDYVEQLARFGHPESDTPRCQASAALDKVTGLCNRVLAQHLFEQLRPYFHKLMKRKWLSSSEAFDTIVVLLTDYAQKLRRMQREPYQALVSEVHRRVLVEYVRPLMQVRLVCSSVKMRGKVAARLADEGRQLQELFSRLESTSSWLNPAVPHLAEILQLEDTPSIQMEVGVLVRDFPDVRKKHVAALLDVRGLRGQAQRQEILAVVKDLELSEDEVPLCRERAFFSEIATTHEVRCFPGALPRLLPACLAFGGRLRWGRPSPASGLRQRQLSEHEAESRV